MANEVTIKIRAFPYYTDAEDPVTGRAVRQEHIATRGDKVELSDVDYDRAKKFDAFYTEEQLAELASAETPPVTDADGFNLESADVEQTAEWLKTEKPTVDEVVERVNEDYQVAQKVLDAEKLATGNQSRSTLVERLQAVIDANKP